jgi:urea transport system substrate-binding protein
VTSPSLSRRAALRRSAAAATLAAARALAPSLFVGCSLGIPLAAEKPCRSACSIRRPARSRSARRPSATSSCFAFERINAARAASWATNSKQRRRTRGRDPTCSRSGRGNCSRLASSAVFGCWTSTSRKAVLPLFEQRDRSCSSTPVQYEGNESSPYCRLRRHACRTSRSCRRSTGWQRGPDGGSKKKIYPDRLRLRVSADGQFHREEIPEASKNLRSPLGRCIFPLGPCRDFAAAVQQIIASGADCVLNTINGDSESSAFSRRSPTQRSTRQELPVVSTSIGEDELRSLLPDQVHGTLRGVVLFPEPRRPQPTDAMDRRISVVTPSASTA